MKKEDKYQISLSIRQNGVDSTVYFFSADKLKSIQCFKYLYGAVYPDVNCLNMEYINNVNMYLELKSRSPYRDDCGIHCLLNENSSVDDFARLKKYASRIDLNAERIVLDFQNVSEAILSGHSNKYVSELEIHLTRTTYLIET